MSARLTFASLALLVATPVADAHERLLGWDGKGLGMMDGDFNMTNFIDEFMKDVNYTDIFDRCCPTNATVLPGTTTQYDLTMTDSCNCPVRNNETFATEWDDSCTNKLGPQIISGETGLFDMDKEFNFTFEVKNYTAVYMKCCPSQEGLPPTDYDVDNTACSCPVREKEEFAEKWSTECEETHGPKSMEEMEVPTVIVEQLDATSGTSWKASNLFAALGVSFLAAIGLF